MTVRGTTDPTRQAGQTLPTLETARLLLRPFALSDAATVQLLAGEREIADTTLNIPHPYADGMAEAWIETHQPSFESRKHITLAVQARDGGHLVGAVGMGLQLAHDSAEIGYWVGRAYWGHGYCTEAAHAMLEFGFGTLCLNRIHAAHFTRNPASGRVLQKLGMIHEGRLRQHFKRWGVFEDIEKYGLLREEFLRNESA